jgi:hypothetical protein
MVAVRTFVTPEWTARALPGPDEHAERRHETLLPPPEHHEGTPRMLSRSAEPLESDSERLSLGAKHQK